MLYKDIEIVAPTWTSIPHVHAFTTLGQANGHVFDVKGDSEIATKSRAKLEIAIAPDTPIYWPIQVHGNVAVVLPFETTSISEADASLTATPRTVCAIRTADCLPVVFASKKGDRVGVAHAGWRGLQAGIIEATFAKLGLKPEETLVWFGPAISGKNYEVGEELNDAFNDYRGVGAFTDTGENKYHMDIYRVGRNILEHFGVPSENISGGEYCTYEDQRFHSARRDGDNSGRMATLIWFE